MEKEVSQYFDLLLELEDDWRVKKITTNHRSKEVSIHIEYIGKGVPIYDHLAKRKWRHLDIMDYKTYIVSKVPRVKNTKGKIKAISVPWASKHERHTYKFEHRVIDLLLATKNQTKTSEYLNVSFRVVNRIMHNSTERGMLRRSYEDLVFEHLSIDEKSFKKGHQYISVLSHPRSGCIIEVEEGRTIEATEQLIDKSLTTQQQKEIQTMSMDMWKSYLTVVKDKLPNASIVHDKFHLIKYLNEAIDKVRRREVKTNDELLNSRYALLKNVENLTDKLHAKFKAIKNANYEVAKAWQIRENFKDIFQKETEKTNAFILFNQWILLSVKQNIKEMTKVVKTFNNHMSGVINVLIYNFNNAMAERLNGKIQKLKTVAKGYRTFKNFRSAILFFNGGLNLYPQI